MDNYVINQSDIFKGISSIRVVHMHFLHFEKILLEVKKKV